MKKRGRKTKRPPKEILYGIYYNQNTTAEEIAKIYKVKKQTVYNWIQELKKENLKNK